jgi:hypothetical protein
MCARHLPPCECVKELSGLSLLLACSALLNASLDVPFTASSCAHIYSLTNLVRLLHRCIPAASLEPTGHGLSACLPLLVYTHKLNQTASVLRLECSTK